ncbi:hypothetical protein GCM10015535_60770 [Streptomyces gelaticus]|uniref:Uncharacterized protein n=1 Tax=Streptomyces gelaticus TaxID=285446 RepID=A0ABQ2W9R6_9ACTN|nr:hypothetical protein GCM10015535_60770 [Streptomyces gelaticus]
MALNGCFRGAGEHSKARRPACPSLTGRFHGIGHVHGALTWMCDVVAPFQALRGFAPQLGELRRLGCHLVQSVTANVWKSAGETREGVHPLAHGGVECDRQKRFSRG